MKKSYRPDQIPFYFLTQKMSLLIVTVTGLIYNIGMAAVPWFEGQLAQQLSDILQGNKTAASMLFLTLCYLITVLLVQGCRALKRLYVRKFSNQTVKAMKLQIYANILRNAQPGDTDQAGELMTKAISDAEACTEGMRKFTTEVFDTGVVLISYTAMLLWYDWKLAIISLLFTPPAYLISERLKIVVTRAAASYKKATAALSTASLERVSNGVTYRVYGLESQRTAEYETLLCDFEKKAIYANVWENSMQPLYQIISLLGVIFILYFGSRNVLGVGWRQWDIAAFSTFLACFSRLALKASKAAKLFNSVQKASVSWKRIRDHLADPIPESSVSLPQAKNIELMLRDVSFSWPGRSPLFTGLSFTLHPGEICGVTGEVACGKSTLGHLLLGELPFTGSIEFFGEDMRMLTESGAPAVGYLGHNPELFSGSIRDNILLGDEGDITPWLKLVCMDQEVASFAEGADTRIGDGGLRLSGGQQSRIALARALYRRRPLLILDDPFSAVDQNTEQQILMNLRESCSDRMILLISHRLRIFPQLDQIIWMDNGSIRVSEHVELLNTEPGYAGLYELQTGGGAEHEV